MGLCVFTERPYHSHERNETVLRMQSLASSISAGGGSLVDVYHAVLALSRMGAKPDAAKVLAATQAALKRDDSVLK